MENSQNEGGDLQNYDSNIQRIMEEDENSPDHANDDQFILQSLVEIQ